MRHYRTQSKLLAMKKTLLFLLLPCFSYCQDNKKELNDLIRKVENNLAPNVIYGDSIPHLNLETQMKKYHARALSIAVIRNYKIEWAKAYGWADEDEKRAATTDTRFQAASISKSINSLGVLKLAEKGKLDTGADINTYLRTWKFPYDSVSKNKKITVNNLLSHTAGLTIHGFPGYEAGAPLPSIPQILNGESPANTKAVRSQFEPGKRFQYSGGGTTISQLIVTDITGRKYEEYMADEILKPIGMSNSSYQQPPASNVASRLTTGYYQDGRAVKGKYHIYPEQAAAGLWTTPTDLAKYIIECQLAYEGRSSKVLSQSMMKSRMTPYIDKAAALGVFIEDRGGIKYFNHNGGNEAFLCTSYGSLQGGNGVVIMINGEEYGVVGELLNSVAQVYGWKDFYKPDFKKVVSVPIETMREYVGHYQLGKDTLSIVMKDNGLVIQQNRQPANGYKIIFSDPVTFSIAEVPNATMKVLRNSEGKVDALELNQGGVMRLPRIKE